MKTLLTGAVVLGIVVIALGFLMLVLDVASFSESKDAITKTITVVAIVTVASALISAVLPKK